MKPPQPGSLGYRAAVAAGRFNVAVIKATKGRLGTRLRGAPVCVLHHVGAKSGTHRETPLLYLRDGEDVVLVASMGGSPKHPSWFHNLRAHPDTDIDLEGRRQPVRARIATAEERDRLWPKLVAMYGDYASYQKATTREIPVVICAPR